MANQPIQCTCNHTKSSPSLSDVTMALMDSKKGAQAASSMLYLLFLVLSSFSNLLILIIIRPSYYHSDHDYFWS